MIKDAYEKHVANIILNSEKCIPSKTGNKARISIFNSAYVLLNIVLEVLSIDIKQISNLYFLLLLN